MTTLQLSNMNLTVNFEAKQITSLQIGGKERLNGTCPLFRLRLRDISGGTRLLDAYDALVCTLTTNGAIYDMFDAEDTLSVQVYLDEQDDCAAWRISVVMKSTAYCVEWVDFPLLTLPALVENNMQGSGGRMLHPYNEGVLVSDINLRDTTDFRYWDPEYPSIGCYSLFPNMISSQMMAYLWDDAGLYLGAHDPVRGLKAIDFRKDPQGIALQMRLFCGVNFGETYTMDYPIVWQAVGGTWEAAAEVYRAWFENNLPPRLCKMKDNPHLPAWYADSPLVVSYPVRGKHDTDDMTPNALYPYTNALPLLNKIRTATGSRLLVLLMHWEGTAPWAPPYVWPPFGGVENFSAFKDALHDQNDLLGVYCSGFGYTIQSKLVDEYNMQDEYDREGLAEGMCAGPDGKVSISRICTAQRSGYDVCPASPVGHDLLAKAYAPLFESGIDYAQILDQNHGGGQYFCYSREHGHPPVPGPWMTTNMQHMLSEWNEQAPDMLFGCESAAAEPFMGNLLFSDNRFELNYMIGDPVPVYAYIYHEYLRNFMGNQVCCNLVTTDENLCYRVAYSFSAGDCMTVVLTPDGDIMSHWGMRDFENVPNKDRVFKLIANLTAFYQKEAQPYLYAGRMISARPIVCETRSFAMSYPEKVHTFPRILTTAWQGEDGKCVQIFVNPEDEETSFVMDGRTYVVSPLSALMVEI